jgi:hypothetical protein
VLIKLRRLWLVPFGCGFLSRNNYYNPEGRQPQSENSRAGQDKNRKDTGFLNWIEKNQNTLFWELAVPPSFGPGPWCSGFLA